MKLTEEEKEYAVEQYTNGATAVQIAKELGCHNSTISKLMQKRGISRGRMWCKRTLDLEGDIIKDFQENGLYCEDIAKKYSIDVHTVYRALDRAGIKRKVGYRSNCNEDYFEIIDTPNKAYILGFITADGAVVNNVLSIEIKASDADLLDFMCKEINEKATIFKPGTSEKDHRRVSFCAKKLSLNLAKYGIVQNKSKLITKVPTEYLSKELLPFYFRGLIDGDGCIHKDGKISIYSGSKLFIEDVQRILVEEVGVSKLGIYHGTSYFVSWGSKEDKKRLFNYLYKDLDATYYYPRKYNRLKNFIDSQANTEIS